MERLDSRLLPVSRVVRSIYRTISDSRDFASLIGMLRATTLRDHELSTLVTCAGAEATETAYATRHHSDTPVMSIRLALGAEVVDTDASLTP